MPGRAYSATGAYRYGFNGKENDNEVKGEGGQQDYGMRIYDPRLGKFLSVDPLAKEYPEYGPYHFAENAPIKFIDLDGAESSDPGIKKSGITHITIATNLFGVMEESSSLTAGKYSLYRSFAMGDSDDFYYTARFYHKDGRFKGMYQDDWIIGPESIGKFIANVKEYERISNRVDFGIEMGGTSDLSARGMIRHARDSWSAENILFGVSMMGKSILRLGQLNGKKRPSWQQAEDDALIANPGYREQVAFKNGREVPNNTRGSVRPEGYKIGASIEVKNYKIITEAGQDRLVNNVVQQAIRRISNLPKGTHQNIVIDMRGNHFKGGARQAIQAFRQIRSRIETQVGSKNVTVTLAFRNGN